MAAGLALALGATPAPAQIWTAPAPLNSTAASDPFVDDSEPQLVSDGQGRWLAVWTRVEGPFSSEGDVVFARSTDDGATWSDPLPLNADAASDSVNDGLPDVATDGTGTFVAVWWISQIFGGPFGTDEDILFARSTDGGVTWSNPQPLDSGAAADSGDDSFPQVTTDGMGTWVAAWHSDDPAGGLGPDLDILFVRSTDGGATWSDPAPLNANAASDVGGDLDVQVTTDRRGTWVAVWESGDSLGGTIGTDSDILFARSTDDGATWSDPEPLNSDAATSPGFEREPQLTTDGRGTWLAVWWSNTPVEGLGDDGDILFARSTDDGATWSDLAPLNTNATTDSDFDLRPRLTTDGLGTWVAIWRFQITGGGPPHASPDVLFARSLDGGATWSDPAPVNVDVPHGAFDYGAQLATDGLVTWLAVWSSDDDLGGTIGLDSDILIARGRGIVGCTPGDRVLCLEGGRFRATAQWRTAQGTMGAARAEPLSGDTGYFWFFDPANVETVVKVLDACVPPFDRFWVFAGGLTNVEVVTTVVDTVGEEVRTYDNPLGTPFQPVQDTAAFDTCGVAATGGGAAWLPSPAAYLAADPEPAAGRGQGPGACIPDATTLCLGGSRFRVTAQWRTAQGTMGPARAEPLTGDTGYFWFFNPANVETVVKVLDACVPPFDRFWVFAGGLTNVEVITTVVDTETNEEQVYTSPLGTPFQPLQDTDAFATCF